MDVPVLYMNHSGRISLNVREDFSLELTLPAENILLAKGTFEMLSGGEDLLRRANSAHPQVDCTTIDTYFGQAARIEFTRSIPDLDLKLVLTIPRDLTETFLVETIYTCRAAAPLHISRLTAPRLCLEQAWADPSAGSLWSLQGAAVEWGQDFAFRLLPDLRRDNFLGHTDYGEGGGIPLVYTWNRLCGLALAHIEMTPEAWYMPVACLPDGVSIGLEDRRSRVLMPGESLHGLRCMISLHQGDFFAPLERYRKVMAANGWIPARTQGEDYAPAWCSWGYEFDIRPENMLGVLPALQDLGIHWFTLDDRWFDRYGDWNPRPDTFPCGAAEMRRLVDRIHQAGGYAQIWWYPLAVEDGNGRYDDQAYQLADILRQHPDWVCLNADGTVARNNRGLAILDPALPQVQEYTLALTRRFIENLGFDGHKLDNIYTVPPCYNPAHHHHHPEESCQAMAQVYKMIYETTRALKPHSVTQICPCGTPPPFTLLPYMDQAVTADPTSSAQIRQRIKFYKALLGPTAAVFSDHVELSDGGSDFASLIGCGGVPSTKFIWPDDPELKARLGEWWLLTGKKRTLWKKWFELDRTYQLSQGEYLNLYDLAFEVPEGHAIRKGQRIYFAFYTSSLEQHYEGPLELRGLETIHYELFDYVDERSLGRVHGPAAKLQVHFCGALLIEAVPVSQMRVPEHSSTIEVDLDRPEHPDAELKRS